MNRLNIILPLLLSACAVHIVEQGNIIPQEAVARLHPGMTRAQVAEILGHPLVQDPGHPDEWAYYYQRGGDLEPVTAWVIVHFDPGGEVARIETSGTMPAGQGIKPGEEAR